MTNNNAVQLTVNMDIKTVEKGATLLMTLGDAAKNTGVLLSSVFNDISIQVSYMVTEIENIVTAIKNATVAVENLTKALGEQEGSDLLFNSLSTGISALSLACDIIEGEKVNRALSKAFEKTGLILSGVSGSIGDVFNSVLAHIMDIPYLSGGKLATGISDSISEYIATFKYAREEVGTFAALFPKLSSTLLSAGGWITSAFASIGTAIAGFAASLGISVGALVGIIAAVVVAIAAIVAVIVIYWDEIKCFFTDTLPQLWQQFVSWLGGIASAIGAFFADCWDRIVAVWTGLAQWVQDNVIQPIQDFFAPIVTWFGELFSNIRQTVSDVFYNIGVIINGVWQIIVAVWQVAASWFNENVIQPVSQFFSMLWTNISALAANAWSGIQNVFLTMATWIDTNVIQPVANFFSGLWNGFVETAEQAWNAVKIVFSAVAGFFGSIFSEAWAKVVAVFNVAGDIFNNIVDGVLGVFKCIVNGLIDGINAVVAVPFNGINFALGVVRDIEILGLTPFADLKMINVPQIPHLAKGAVLPANKPFLAMVGDQKHGTNVEAPLATIQEAVAIVMEDMIASNMAGHEATVGVLREILSAVLGIQIGDDVIGQAVARYDRKMAVMRGGYV